MQQIMLITDQASNQRVDRYSRSSVKLGSQVSAMARAVMMNIPDWKMYTFAAAHVRFRGEVKHWCHERW